MPKRQRLTNLEKRFQLKDNQGYLKKELVSRNKTCIIRTLKLSESVSDILK
jgi:hypothetical protein